MTKIRLRKICQRTNWFEPLFLTSIGKINGYRKLQNSLCDLGETCSPDRIARLVRLAEVYTEIGYKRRRNKWGGKPAVILDTTLGRQFSVKAHNKVRVPDVNYIKTHEGFSYLAIMIDLLSRRIFGWTMYSRQPTDPVLQALLIVFWRHKPKRVMRPASKLYSWRNPLKFGCPLFLSNLMRIHLLEVVCFMQSCSVSSGRNPVYAETVTNETTTVFDTIFTKLLTQNIGHFICASELHLEFFESR